MQTMISTVREDGKLAIYIIYGIALSTDALTAWKDAGSKIYNEFGARIIAIRLKIKVKSIFLISAFMLLLG